MHGAGIARLAADVVVEPLVRSWYAWPFLIAPATSALAMTGSHVAIMESFLKAPRAHEAANADPLMAGGPYMDVPASSVDAVARIYQQTKERFVGLAALADAIRALARRLDAAQGESLEGTYLDLPDILRGRVELVYDLGHRASLRLIEPLLYRAEELDLEGGQSLTLRRWNGVRRPFVLSTPRLPDKSSLEVQVPFSSSVVDNLMSSRWNPVDVGRLADQIGVSEERLQPFMTSSPLPDSQTTTAGHKNPGLDVRYFGHATLLIETSTTSVLLDPFLTFDTDQASGWPISTGYEIPAELDAIVLTHAHLDHVSIETLLQLRTRVERIIVPRSGSGELQDPSLRALLMSIGFNDVVELGEFDSLQVGDMTVTAFPFLGEHGDLRINTKAAFAIAGNGRQVVAVVDSRNLDGRLYDRIAAEVGAVDAVFLGMECVGAPLTWLYGDLYHQPVERQISESRRLAGSNAEQAFDLVRRLDARRAYVYAMGVEPWLWHLTTVTESNDSPQIIEASRFVERCRHAGIEAERLRGAAEIVL